MSNKYKRKSEPMNRWFALVMALISIFMGTVFSSTMFLNRPIDREDATELTCTYKDFIAITRRGRTREIKLLFYDDSAQYIEGSCIDNELVENLKKIPIGTNFKILVNPKNNCVVELIASDDVLLDFDYAQKQLERDGVGFFYLGVTMYAFAIAFIVQAVLDFKKKIKRARAKRTLN